jgi:hypothetical protein
VEECSSALRTQGPIEQSRSIKLMEKSMNNKTLPSYEDLNEEWKKEYKDAAQEIADENNSLNDYYGADYISSSECKVPENSDGVRKPMFPSSEWNQKMLRRLGL